MLIKINSLILKNGIIDRANKKVQDLYDEKCKLPESEIFIETNIRSVSKNYTEEYVHIIVDGVRHEILREELKKSIVCL